MNLTRDQILSVSDSKVVPVAVPEWGGTVFVRMMTGAERDEYERAQYDLVKLGQMGANMRAHLVAVTACDEAGTRLFTSADVDALGRKSYVALERVVNAARQLNVLTEDGVEEVAKN